MSATLPHIKAGKLRPLAVTTLKRVPTMPDVPTIAESGFAGFEAPAWWAVLAGGARWQSLHCVAVPVLIQLGALVTPA